MKLTRGKLAKQEEWPEWQQSEYLQLDQYEKQGMFGDPVPMEYPEKVFTLVCTYVIKELDS